MTTEERIQELEEMKSEYILNESVIPDPCSYGELAEAQDAAESCWNNTADGKELIALQHLKGNEQAAELYYALKAMLSCPDYAHIHTHELRQADTLIYNLEKDD